MVRCLSSAFLFLLVLGGYAQAQESKTKQDSERNTVFRVHVDLVQVDAIVTDSDGRPVDDLKAEDFIVTQDGKPREIVSFSMIRRRKPVLNPTIASMPESKDKDGISPPPPPPVELKRDKVRRAIALVVDDLGLTFESIVRTRESLRIWVDTEMQPDDLVAVILTGKGIGTLQQFTTDKRILYAAIDRIMFNGLSRTSRAGWGISSSEVEMGRFLGTIGSIKYVLNGLNSIAGRKSLIFFSGSMGLLRDELNSANEIVLRRHMQDLIDEANRAAVVIHTIDPRGVVYTGLTALDSGSGFDEDSISQVSGDRTMQLEGSRDGLVSMAKMTGGLFEQNRNDIANAVKEVANDGEVYYLLGYKPDEKTLIRIKEGRRFLISNKVRVKRKGLRVRSRSGFFGEPAQLKEPLTRREHIEAALVSPFVSGNLPVRLTALYSQTKDKKGYLNALLHIETNRMAFTDKDGWKNAVVDIVSAIFNAEGKEVDVEHKAWSIQAKGQTFDEMQKYGVVFLMRIPVEKAGPYQIRAVVSDAGSDELGSASQFVEVPNVGKGRLALSGIALSADAMQRVAVQDQPEGMVADREVNGTVAVRVFNPGDTITWAYQIINAKTGDNSQSQLQTYVRLFRDGRELYAADTKYMTLETQEESNRMIGTGRMELHKIMPGIYTLQVIVRDMRAKEKHRTAVQSINFEILNPKLARNDSGIMLKTP